MVEQSVLKPVDAALISSAETEEAAPWIVRKLVGVCPQHAQLLASLTD